MMELDCLGLLCPAPIHLTARAIARLPAGATLTIRADDPVIAQDMPSWCAQTGHTIASHRVDGAVHEYVVRKSGTAR